MTPIRTFVAIHLTPALIAALQQTQDALRATSGGLAGRWVPADNMHLTLKFLGDVESARLAEVHAAVDGVAGECGPLTLTLQGMGCFPSARRPRVVWAGIHEPTGRLPRLAEALDAALGRLGFAREQRAFRAHLTLARIREGAPGWQVEALGQAVESHQPPEVSMVAHELAVVRSDLRPQGPLYSDLHTAALSGPNAG